MFPSNWKQAYDRLESTERKLKKQPELATKYQAIIEGYVADGHARKLLPEEIRVQTEKRWFLPHHAVVNPNKPGKVRVVFDAAAKHRGTSLNDKLVTGPDLLQSLPGVLLRFREGLIAVTADIKQMYHQVRIREEDQPASSFLWRDMEGCRKPDVYQMLVVIFGAKSSPAIANYVLRRALIDYEAETKTRTISVRRRRLVASTWTTACSQLRLRALPNSCSARCLKLCRREVFILLSGAVIHLRYFGRSQSETGPVSLRVSV